MSAGEVAERSALGSLLFGALLIESTGADFKRGTWTFKVGPHVQASAGQYVVIPAIIARLALEQEACENAGSVVIRNQKGLRGRYYGVNGDQALEISSADGDFDMTLYKRYPRQDKVGFPTNSAHWCGRESRKDTHGRSWSSNTPTYVMNDFGNLVEVSE